MAQQSGAAIRSPPTPLKRSRGEAAAVERGGLCGDCSTTREVLAAT